jgi:N-acyl-L-homoserine lactone synthetase
MYPMLSADELKAADVLARRLMRADRRIRYTTAQTPAEIEQVLRLRYQTVIAKSWAKPEDYPDGMERDEYDDDAIHIVGWQEENLAVTMRLVLPSPTRPLPTEAAFNIRIEPYGQVTDGSRAIVAPDFRDRSQTLFFGVFARVWVEMRHHGYELICGTFTQSMIEWIGQYEKGGFVIETLGEPQEYWGEKRYPSKFNIPATLQRMRG